MFHIAAIHSALALKNLVSALGDFVAAEVLATAVICRSVAIAVTKVATTAIHGRVLLDVLLQRDALILFERVRRRRDFGITFS